VYIGLGACGHPNEISFWEVQEKQEYIEARRNNQNQKNADIQNRTPNHHNPNLSFWTLILS
jgi:hypothetical protein